MLKKTLIIFAFLLTTTLSSVAQGKDKDKKEQANTTETATQLLQPIVVKIDLIFLYNALNTIELKATEVEAFLEVQEKLKVFIDNPQFQQMNPEQQVKIEFDPVVMDKLIIFSNRISLLGGDAVKYKRIMLAFLESAKNFKQSAKPTK